MLVPVSETFSAAVELVCTNQTPPAILQAQATWFDGASYKVTLRDAASAPPQVGERVILDFGENESPRVLAIVTERDGGDMNLTIKRSQPRDKREFPRMHGGIQLRYTVVQDVGAADAWVSRGESAPTIEWFTPDPFMDFSASGLKFDDAPNCADNDLLLVHLEVPTAEGSWRGVARVVRVSEILPEDREEGNAATHHVAVEFQTLPAEAIEALMTFTLHLQGALL